MRGNTLLAAITLVVMAMGAATAALAQPQTVVSCPTGGQTTADPTTHGFYVQNFDADNLATVTLTYYATVTGTYLITLRAAVDTFDGQLIATRTRSLDVSTANVPNAVTFDFEGAPLPHGSTVVFSQSVLGPAEDGLTFDTGTAPCAATETKDFAAPTSSVVRNSVGVTITAAPAGSCVPAGTTLCVSDVQGDNRFQVIATYKTAQSGGLSGSANAVDLTNTGITKGGVLWFFDKTNPEMLVKVLNGCAVDNNYWVFYSADTNVGFTVTVTDMTSGRTKTYTNPDVTAAAPIQDTAAFPCS